MDQFLHCNTANSSSSNLRLKRVESENFTNGLILEIYGYTRKQQLSTATCIEWVRGICPRDIVINCTDDALRMSIRNLHLKKQGLDKRKLSRAELLAASYQAPHPKKESAAAGQTCQASGLVAIPKPVQTSGQWMEAMVHPVEAATASTSEEPSTTVCGAKINDEDACGLQRALNLQTWKTNKLHKALQQKNNKLRQLQDCTNKDVVRNKSKLLKRRDATICRQKVLLQQQKEEIQQKEDQLKTLERKIGDLEHTKTRAKKLKSYYKNKSYQTKEETEVETELQKEVVELQQKLSTISAENLQLHHQICTFSESMGSIQTFEDGKFTDNIRLLYMYLLSLNIGINNVEKVIRTTLQTLSNQTVGRLPSYGTTAGFFAEARALAQMQLGDILTSTENNTLCTDATTKKHHHYSSFNVMTKNHGQLIMGLRENLGGSTDQECATLDDIIKDICQVCCNDDDSSQIKDLIVSACKCTMTDRHIVNKCLNERLQKIRAEVMPRVTEGWQDLSVDEREERVNMYNHFCSMHYIVNLATAADEGLHLFENAAAEQAIGAAAGTFFRPSKTESGTHRLIRTACKAFSPGACEKSGYPLHFQAMVAAQQGKVHLVDFRGNRFNILFEDGAAVYHHRHHLISLRESLGGGNKLVEAVLADIAEPMLQAGCRALGIFNAVLTSWLWALIETKNCILDLRPAFQQVQACLRLWREDPSELEGSTVTFDGVTLSNSPVTQSLFEASDDIRDMTRDCIAILAEKMLVITERQLGDYLEGGKFFQVSETAAEQMQTCGTTNTGLERNFACLDRELKIRPNATTRTIEGKTMFLNNKTYEYVSNLKQTDKENKFAKARQSARDRSETKKRKDLEHQRIKLIEESAQKKTTEN